MSSISSNPTYPAVLLSPSDGRRQYLDTLSGQEALPTMQLGHYLFRNMQGALLVDSQGNSHQVTNVALRGVGWRHYAAAGIFLNLVLLPFEILTLGLMVRISITTQLGEPISLQQLKSQVLACMAKSTGNFKGRGGANEWRAPVDTAQSFSQLVGRLNLFREAA